jgi:hypothetical protein
MPARIVVANSDPDFLSDTVGVGPRSIDVHQLRVYSLSNIPHPSREAGSLCAWHVR